MGIQRTGAEHVNPSKVNDTAHQQRDENIDEQLSAVKPGSVEHQKISQEMKAGVSEPQTQEPALTQEDDTPEYTRAPSEGETSTALNVSEKEFETLVAEEETFIKTEIPEKDHHPEIQRVKVECLQKVRKTKPADALKNMSKGFGIGKQDQAKIGQEADKPSVIKALRSPDAETGELFKSINTKANKEAYEAYNNKLVGEITGARKCHIKESLVKIQKKVPHPMVVESVLVPLKNSPLKHQKTEEKNNSEVLYGLNHVFKTGESHSEKGLGEENLKENSKLRKRFRHALKGDYKETVLGRPLKALGGILMTALAGIGLIGSRNIVGAVSSVVGGAGSLMYSGYQISHSEGSKRYSGMGLFQGEIPGSDMNALTLRGNPEFKGTKYEQKTADENSKFFARCFRFSKNQAHGEKVSKARIFFGRLAAHHSTRSIAPKWLRPLTALVGTVLSIGLIAPMAYNIYRSVKETQEISLAINHSPNEPIIDSKTGEEKPNLEAKRLRALTDIVADNYKTEFKANVKANATGLINQVTRNTRDAALSVVKAGKRVIKGIGNGINNVKFLGESLEKSVDKLDQATAEAVHHFQGKLKDIQDKMSVAILVHQSQISALIDMANEQPVGSPIYNKLMGEIMDYSSALEKRFDILNKEASEVMEHLLNGARDKKGHRSYRFTYNDDTGKKHDVKFKGIRWQLNKIIKWKAGANTLFKDNASFQGIQNELENVTQAFAHIGTQQNFLNSSLSLMLVDQQLAGVETILDVLASDIKPEEAGPLKTYTDAVETLKTNLEKSLEDYQKSTNPEEYPSKLQSVKTAIAELKKVLSNENPTFKSLSEGVLSKKLGDYKLSQYFEAVNSQLYKLAALANRETGIIVEGKAGSGATIEDRADYIAETKEGITFEVAILSETLMRGMASFTGEVRNAFSDIADSKAWLQGFDTQIRQFSEFQKNVIKAFDADDFTAAGKELQRFILTFNSSLENQRQRLTRDQQSQVNHLFKEMEALATNLTREVKTIVEAKLGRDLPKIELPNQEKAPETTPEPITQETPSPQTQEPAKTPDPVQPSKIERAEKAIEGDMSAQIEIAEEIAQDRRDDLEELKEFYEHSRKGYKQVLESHKIKPADQLKALNALEEFWTGFNTVYTDGQFAKINDYLLKASTKVISAAPNKEIKKVIQDRMAHIVEQLAFYNSDALDAGQVTDFSHYNKVAQAMIDKTFPSLEGAQVTKVEFNNNSKTFRIAITHKGHKYNMQFTAPIFPPGENSAKWDNTINLKNPNHVKVLVDDILPGIESDLEEYRKDDHPGYEESIRSFNIKENTQFFLHRAADEKRGVRFRMAKKSAKSALKKDLTGQGTYFNLYMTLAKTLLKETVPTDTVQAVAEKQKESKDMSAEEMLRSINNANDKLWETATSLRKETKKGSKDTKLKNPRLFVAPRKGKLEYALLRDSNAKLGNKSREMTPEDIDAQTEVSAILEQSGPILEFIRRYNGGSLEGIELLFEKGHPIRVVVTNNNAKDLSKQLVGLFGAHQIEVIKPSTQKKAQMDRPYKSFT